MSEVKEFIRENFGSRMTTIPWDLHPFIGIKDAAFVSLYPNQFKLDDQYYAHIDIEEYNRTCQEYDNLRVVVDFENKENVCLLVAVLCDGCHDDIYSTMETNDDSQKLFTKEFLNEAWNYAVAHNLTSGHFGDVIKKLGYSPEVDSGPFTVYYFSNFGPKSARERSDAALHMASD